jgi:hypothetical protein
MKPNFAIVMIAPDFNTDYAEADFNQSIEKAEKAWIRGANDGTEIKWNDKWAYGFLVWNEIVTKYPELQPYVLMTRTIRNSKRPEPYTFTKYKNLNIMEVQFTGTHGHLMEKSLRAFEFYLDYPEIEYMVRGNCNTILDCGAFQEALKVLPKEKVYTCPIWQGGSYAIGFHSVFSRDTVQGIVKMAPKDPWWLSRPSADDHDLMILALAHCDAKGTTWSNGGTVWGKATQTLPVDKCPTLISKYGIIGSEVELFETELQPLIEQAPPSLFMYRFRNLKGSQYVQLYKTILTSIYANHASRTAMESAQDPK